MLNGTGRRTKRRVYPTLDIRFWQIKKLLTLFSRGEVERWGREEVWVVKAEKSRCVFNRRDSSFGPPLIIDVPVKLGVGGGENRRGGKGDDKVAR